MSKNEQGRQSSNNTILAALRSDEARHRIRNSRRFTLNDIALISETYARHGNAPGGPWDEFRNTHMILPDWFRADLDPLSDQYRQQQERLWQAISGTERNYDPRVDEQEVEVRADPVRHPGYIVARDPSAIANAGDHVIAMGMIMKHSGLRAGNWALEYGAGFGQTALMLARMGVNVDTVDISSTFCRYVKEQADFFQVNLTPFQGEFGLNPRENQKYDLIFFYESFHHCLDFRNVLNSLKDHLTPGGKILLAGEPIQETNLAIPYPWGLRLESEVVAVIRNRKWCELGFTYEFIQDVFTTSGFCAAPKIPCPISQFGEIHTFTLRPGRISLNSHGMSARDAATWHAPDPSGRWTKERSCLTLDSSNSFDALAIHATNHHPFVQTLDVIYGSQHTTVEFHPGEQKIIKLKAASKNPVIVFESKTFVPASDYSGNSHAHAPDPTTPTASQDQRALGIFISHLEYV